MSIRVGDSFWDGIEGDKTPEFAAWFRRKVELCLRALWQPAPADRVVEEAVAWYANRQAGYLIYREADYYQAGHESTASFALDPDRVRADAPLALAAARLASITSVDEWIAVIHAEPYFQGAPEPSGPALLRRHGWPEVADQVEERSHRNEISWPRRCRRCGEEFRPVDRVGVVNCPDCRGQRKPSEKGAATS